MKALFFLLDGQTNASSYYRVLQYLPFLRAAGVDVKVARPSPEWFYERTMERQSVGTGGKAAFYGAFLAGRFVDVARSGAYDVVVIQRDLFPFGPPVLERLLRRVSGHVVYDTDDATYLRPAFTPNTLFQRLRRFDKVAEVVGTARWVSVATEPIAAWARQYNPRVSVVPMALDVEAYARLAQRMERGPGLVLGWAGTGGGLRYLEMLGPALREVAGRYPLRVRVVTGAPRDVRLPGIPVEVVPWEPATALASMADVDVGLIPLADSEFERAKCPFKMLQYMAWGIPCVCSRVGEPERALRDGESGLLAGSTGEWVAALVRLADSPEERRRIGRAGQDVARARYSVETVAPLLLDGLREAARG